MSDVAVSQLTSDDFESIGRLLVDEGLCKVDGLSSRVARSASISPETCLIAKRDHAAVGALLAVFNGFHVFLSHVIVRATEQNLGIGKRLHEELVARAVKLGTIGIITDARLTATGFYYDVGYRLPGAVFLVRDVP
jgi:predicted N-acetyltransferase YhbS